MKFKILTIFPQMIEAVLGESILRRARKSGAIETEVIDIRPFSDSKHKNTDDTPFGGGAGMVMLPQPVTDAIHYAMGENFHGKRIYLSPRGTPFTQKKAEELAKEDTLILLCGHYEGLDQRVIDRSIDEEISVGDYVLTGGELGALIITDAVSRLVHGVLGCEESSVDESFSSGLLEYPQYTRPREFGGDAVPQVLVDGNQKIIDRWRRDESVKITYERRPEMLKNTVLDKYDRVLLRCLRDAKTKTRLAVRGEDPELIARLEEKSGFQIEFCPEDSALSLLILNGDNGNLPQCVERVLTLSGRSDDSRVFTLYPTAMDARLNLARGDEGIAGASFFGMSQTEFACAAASLLPVKKGVGGYCADYGKSRRAYRKAGERKAIRLEYFNGEITEFAPCGVSDAFITACADYLLRGTKPILWLREGFEKILNGRKKENDDE